jgi:hypothetical protein
MNSYTNKFKEGTIWKKTFKIDKSYVIFKIIKILDGEADIIIIKDGGYGNLKDKKIIIPPNSDLSTHSFEELTELQAFCEVL